MLLHIVELKISYMRIVHIELTLNVRDVFNLEFYYVKSWVLFVTKQKNLNGLVSSRGN